MQNNAEIVHGTYDNYANIGRLDDYFNLEWSDIHVYGKISKMLRLFIVICIINYKTDAFTGCFIDGNFDK